MGGNQVKATHSSPLLHVESVALSCQDDQERHYRKGLPRRLGSMLLAEWVPLKRREQEVAQKAQAVVVEGRAPPELLKEVEMLMKSATYKPHIKYHPKFKPKPKKPRLKGPRLTQTAARRIQDAYERREKQQQQQQQQERAAQRRGKSRLSVRSHGWTDSGSCRASKRTPTETLKHQQRASSLPPSSTLSLQSITTAESSGIGMSRASSLTSVASLRHRKTFFTRQRAQSVDADDIGGERLQPMQQQGSRRESPQTEKRVSPSGRSPKTESGTAGKQRWKIALRQSFQQVIQQKARRQTALFKTKQASKQQRMTKTMDSTEPQLIHPLNREVRLAAPQKKQEAAKQQLELQGDGELSLQVPDSEQRASPSSQGEDQLKEKKEQGSQTRLSGPPRPRRLLLLRPGKNKVKQEEVQHEESRGQTTPGCSVFQNKINSKEKWKRLLRMNKKDSKNEQRQERRTSLTTSQDQGRGHRHLSSPDVPRRVSVDENIEHTSEQRRHSQPAASWHNRGENPESKNLADPHQPSEGDRIIRVSRHHTPIDGGEVVSEDLVQQQPMHEPGQQESYQGSTSYAVEARQYRRPNNRYQLAEEQFHLSQGTTLGISSADPGYCEAVLNRRGSRRSSEEQGMVESDGQQGRFSELPLSSDEQSGGGGGWSGTNVEEGRTTPVRSPNVEQQMALRPLGIVEQGRTVEAQGSRRPGSFAGRGQDLAHDRGRMSAVSLDHGIFQAPLEARLVTERGSPDRMRHHTPLERLQRDPVIEHGRHEHPIEILHGEAPVRATERIHRGSIIERPLRDSSTERLYHNTLIERGHRESLMDYPRLEGTIDRVRPDVSGRGADRILPRVTQDRTYFPARLDRGYSYDAQEDRRGRQERRYTVGTVEPSYLGTYAERHIIGRLSEPENNRIYSGRITYSRALDSEPIRSRSIDHELARTYSYSESDYPSRIIDHEQAKIYAERLVAGGKLRGTEDYELRERGGRYRDAVVAQHTIASAPLVDHRSL